MKTTLGDDIECFAAWLGSLVKGKGKGKGGKGNKGGKSNDKDMTCYNYGKQGHKAADCWSKKKEGSKGSKDGKGKKGSSKGSSDGKKGKGKGKHKKHASALDEAAGEEDAEYEAGDEPENEEVGTFEMNGVTVNSEPLECGEWTKFNLDTGAA